MSLLLARDLGVALRTRGGELPVLRRIDITLHAGQVLGLVGESGAGKSMIGHTIAKMLPPGFAVNSGTLSFDGRDLVGMTPARHRALLGRDIAFIPQEPLTALNPVLTVGMQIGEHLARLGVPKSQRRERATAALEAVHLPNAPSLLARHPHQLSGGMCQRVLIAMAFAGRPRLVIADEPTTALDVTIQAHVMALMAELQRAHGTAILFITHDLRLAARVCDDVTVLYAGSIVERGRAREVLQSAFHPYTRCLELATPALHAQRRSLFVLPNQMPELQEMSTLRGCRFAPRCPLAAPACIEAEPTLPEQPHAAACFYAARTISINTCPNTASRHTAEGDAVLEVIGLSKRFSAGRVFRRAETIALHEASFQVGSGEFVGVVGESGSGKTTLGRLVVGLERPSAGRIRLCGTDVTGGTSDARRHRISTVQMIFQDPQSALNPRRRVASIVTQVMEAQHASVSARQRRAAELLTEMGLSAEVAARRPSQLSGGQRQRVNIARALCRLPKLLVADEIVSGLDVSVQAQLLALLQRLRAELAFAMLFISHDLSVVRHLCDRVLVMHRGEIVEQGPTERVFSHPQHGYTRTLLASAAG